MQVVNQSAKQIDESGKYEEYLWLRADTWGNSIA